MKSPIFLLSVCMLLATFASADTVAPKFPPHIIVNSELRVMPRAANGRTYQLHVRLPLSYAQEPTRHYPVLYVTDAYWDFPTLVSSYDNLVYDKVVPECIIVGLGYASENLDYNKARRWELSPVADPGKAQETGHAAEFLAYLEKEIIPFIDLKYRTDPSFRGMSGSSLGGLFTLYCMYTRPELFQAYIAVSPAAADGPDWIFGYEEKFAQSGAAIKGRLFMTGAENESRAFLDGIKRFNAKISAHKYPGLTYEFRLIDGERHAGTKAEGYVRGMRFVFAPLAPESGPSK